MPKGSSSWNTGHIVTLDSDGEGYLVKTLHHMRLRKKPTVSPISAHTLTPTMGCHVAVTSPPANTYYSVPKLVCQGVTGVRVIS